MDPDLNKYDVEHVCAAHPQDDAGRVGGDLSRRPGRSITRPSTSKTLLRRAAATGVPMGSLVKVLLHVHDHRSAWKTSIRCKAACFA